VLLSLQRALLGEIPPALRGVTCSWTSEAITIRCLFDGAIQEDDREAIEFVATEVTADFTDYMVHLECQRVDVPERLNPYSLLEWVYWRKEAM
jgi:hypothetical protein